MKIENNIKQAGQRKMNESTEKFVNVAQLSKLIGHPAYTIRRLVREGVLPAYRLTGKQYLFDVSEVVAIIKNKPVNQ